MILCNMHTSLIGSDIGLMSGTSNQKHLWIDKSSYFIVHHLYYNNHARLSAFSWEIADIGWRIWPQIFPPQIDSKLECLFILPRGASSSSTSGSTIPKDHCPPSKHRRTFHTSKGTTSLYDPEELERDFIPILQKDRRFDEEEASGNIRGLTWGSGD